MQACVTAGASITQDGRPTVQIHGNIVELSERRHQNSVKELRTAMTRGSAPHGVSTPRSAAQARIQPHTKNPFGPDFDQVWIRFGRGGGQLGSRVSTVVRLLLWVGGQSGGSLDPWGRLTHVAWRRL